MTPMVTTLTHHLCRWHRHYSRSHRGCLSTPNRLCTTSSHQLQARIDAHHTRTEGLLLRAIQGDIYAAIDRGRTPLPIPTLPPRPGQDADQGAGPGATQGWGPQAQLRRVRKRIQRFRIVVFFFFVF
ncbi:hypothetical protein Hanom_Chr06g00538771 [Helianthus anomalus]